MGRGSTKVPGSPGGAGRSRGGGRPGALLWSASGRSAGEQRRRPARAGKACQPGVLEWPHGSGSGLMTLTEVCLCRSAYLCFCLLQPDRWAARSSLLTFRAWCMGGSTFDSAVGLRRRSSNCGMASPPGEKGPHPGGFLSSGSGSGPSPALLEASLSGSSPPTCSARWRLHPGLTTCLCSVESVLV